MWWTLGEYSEQTCPNSGKRPAPCWALPGAALATLKTRHWRAKLLPYNFTMSQAKAHDDLEDYKNTQQGKLHNCLASSEKFLGTKRGKKIWPTWKEKFIKTDPKQTLMLELGGKKAIRIVIIAVFCMFNRLCIDMKYIFLEKLTCRVKTNKTIKNIPITHKSLGRKEK